DRVAERAGWWSVRGRVGALGGGSRRRVGDCPDPSPRGTRPYIFNDNPAVYFPPCRFPLMMEFRRSRAKWRAAKSLQTGGTHYVRKSTRRHLPVLTESPAE